MEDEEADGCLEKGGLPETMTTTRAGVMLKVDERAYNVDLSFL